MEVWVKNPHTAAFGPSLEAFKKFSKEKWCVQRSSWTCIRLELRKTKQDGLIQQSLHWFCFPDSRSLYVPHVTVCTRTCIAPWCTPPLTPTHHFVFVWQQTWRISLKWKLHCRPCVLYRNALNSEKRQVRDNGKEKRNNTFKLKRDHTVWYLTRIN